MADVSTSANVRHKIIFDPTQQTASIEVTEGGKKKTLTIFANSGDKNAQNNSIFDANDKIIITDSNNKPVTDAKVDAGIVKRLLKAINGKTIAQAQEIKEVKGTGTLFDATQMQKDGVTYSIKTMGTLFDAVNSLENDGHTTENPSQRVSISIPSYPTRDDKNFAALINRLTDLQNKQRVISSLANTARASQMYLTPFASPYAFPQAQTFAANGFDIAAFLSMQNSPVIQAFERSAGISITDALSSLEAEKKAIGAELAQLLKSRTQNQSININNNIKVNSGTTPGGESELSSVLKEILATLKSLQGEKQADAVQPTVTPTTTGEADAVQPTVTPTTTGEADADQPTVTPTATGEADADQPTVTPTTTGSSENNKDVQNEPPQDELESLDILDNEEDTNNNLSLDKQIIINKLQNEYGVYSYSAEEILQLISDGYIDSNTFELTKKGLSFINLADIELGHSDLNDDALKKLETLKFVRYYMPIRQTVIQKNYK